jgi:hypothetical protein
LLSLLPKSIRRKSCSCGAQLGNYCIYACCSKRPDLFYAYVGIGQVINTRENERLSYNYAIEQATKLKNDKALKNLLQLLLIPAINRLPDNELLLPENGLNIMVG